MNEILEPLQKLDNILKNSSLVQELSHLVDIELAVVGGALRDTLLGKPIKDIDIHVRINLWKNLKVDRAWISYRDEFRDEKLAALEAEAILNRSHEILEFMKQDKYAKVREAYPPDNDGVKAIICLVRYLLKEHSDYQLKEEARKVVVSGQLGIEKIAYINMGLSAVVGVKDKTCKYPIELLFSQDSINNFVRDFDFNLCKISMGSDGAVIETPEFAIDVKNKTMTYEPKYGIGEKEIQKSLGVRYERLYEKYADYELVSKVEHVSKSLQPYIEEFVKISKSYHSLKDLPEKNVKHKRYKL